MSSIPPPERADRPRSAATPPGASEQQTTDVPGAWRLWMAPAAVLLGFGLGQAGAIAVNVVGQAAGHSTLAHPSPAVTILSNVAFDLGFVLAALYFTSRAGRVRPLEFGFRRIGFWQGVAAVVVAGVGYYLVTALYAGLLGLRGKDKLPSELGVSHHTAALIGAAIFVCVIAPVAEEFFFRGFLFGVLRRWRIVVLGRNIGVWVAAVVVGILFGLAHTGSASSQYLVPLGFLGFVLCLLRWRTRSLYPGMALHSLNNSLALGVNELRWSVLATVALILAALMVIAALTGPLAPDPPARTDPARA